MERTEVDERRQAVYELVQALLGSIGRKLQHVIEWFVSRNARKKHECQVNTNMQTI